MIKNCPEWKKHHYRLCYHCPKFPCKINKHLDKRYRKNYGVSPIENLEFIKANGISKFIRREKKKWISDKGVLCCHDGKVYSKKH